MLIKKIYFFGLWHPSATHEGPQQMSANLVQPFGRPEETYIYGCVVLLYTWIDIGLKNKSF